MNYIASFVAPNIPSFSPSRPNARDDFASLFDVSTIRSTLLQEHRALQGGITAVLSGQFYPILRSQNFRNLLLALRANVFGHGHTRASGRLFEILEGERRDSDLELPPLDQMNIRNLLILMFRMNRYYASRGFR
jgi:hypothetical protein